MLGKLIKHEFKATYWNYCLLYIVLIVLTIFNKLFWLINSENVILNVIRAFITVLYIVSIVAVFVMTFILIISRFYKNLLKDEGYLSFTLPVTVNQHIVTKLLVSFIWEVLTAIIVILSLLIMAIDTELYRQLPVAWDYIKLFIQMNDGVVGIGIAFVFLMILSAFMGTLMCYASLSLGQLFTKHKIAGAVLCFIGFYFIVQIVSSVTMTGIMMGDSTLMQLAINNEVMPMNIGISFFGRLFIVSIIMQLIITAAYYIITYLMLKKKLNLE